MKSQTLPTKRKPVSKGVFRKLSAVTTGRRRKQRAATTAGARDFDDQGSARIGRALFVILLIHILAVAMIFVHHRFLSDRPLEEASVPAAETKIAEAQAPAVAPEAVPENGVVRSQLSPDETPYIVARGETYSSIAAAHQISEKDLRELNNNAAIRPGYLLKIPVKRVVIKASRPQVVSVAAPAPAVPVAASAPAVPARDQGLVEAVDTRNAPRATAVTVSTNGKYVVQKGDTIWRIAHKHGVDQNKLMEANGISDPRKLRLGMTLKIP